jgi:molybdopterin-guanine dinucleotide biosynthesis protein
MTIFVIAGTASNVGKTSLVCDLLRAFPGYEAIKLTRGHSRSCGRAPAACCVSPLLQDEPLILSDPEQTKIPGKDTGKYWVAGASNVHWVIAKEDQVESGIRQALARVTAPGVIVEGTSVLRYLQPSGSILVTRSPLIEIKPTARKALQAGHIRSIYLNGLAPLPLEPLFAGLPIYTPDEFPALVNHLSSL